MLKWTKLALEDIVDYGEAFVTAVVILPGAVVCDVVDTYKKAREITEVFVGFVDLIEKHQAEAKQALDTIEKKAGE